MSPPAHHPEEDMLLEYATGTLREVHALLVATHLAYCPECRRMVSLFEALGGDLLDTLPPAPLADDALDGVLARLDDPTAPPAERREPAPLPGPGETLVPEPLRSYLGRSPEAVAWQPLAPGVHLFDLGLGQAPTAVMLLRMDPGSPVPAHSHTAREFLLVLKGSFSDEYGHYRLGDVAALKPSTDHHAVGGRDGECICLLLLEGPLRFDVSP